MIVIHTKVLPPGAVAMTVFPFMLIHPDPDHAANQQLLRHEHTHYEQQRRWAIYGVGIGLVVWFLLYLLVLPVYWNPFRDRWEREAFKAGEKFYDAEIDEILSRRPYYLWSLTNHRILR